MKARYDVVIVGAGNAAFSAAHASIERVGRVLVLEKAPREWAGGNSYFTAGAIRTTYDGLDDLRPIVENLTDELAATTELPPYTPDDFMSDMERVTEAGGNSYFTAGAIRTTYEGLEDLRPLVENLTDELAAATELPPYTPDDFMSDMERVTEGRCDKELTRILVDDAADTTRWLHEKGLRYRLMYDRQSFEVNGKRRFWGGLVLGTVGGGRGLVEQHIAAAERSGIEVRYDSPVVGLLQEDEAVTGVVCKGPDGREEIGASAIVLASGGFESDPRMRAAYLGPQWDVAKVRGTPYNTGEVLRIALESGAQPYGNWSGCHAIAWDAAAPPTGDRELTNLLSKQSYPLGIVVNKYAQRFIDEGADFRNYTYAKYGAEIL